MKALFIGGTGTISSGISKRAVELGWDLWLLNRGFRKDRVVPGATVIAADINSDESALADQIRGMDFDVVVDFIAFVPGQLERDVRLFFRENPPVHFYQFCVRVPDAPGQFSDNGANAAG